MSETSYDCIEEESERDGENVVSGEDASENSEEDDIEGEGDDDEVSSIDPGILMIHNLLEIFSEIFITWKNILSFTYIIIY